MEKQYGITPDLTVLQFCHKSLTLASSFLSPSRSVSIVQVDNYATHKPPKVKRWLATHPRWHIHCTRRGASWLNQIEIWFNIMTKRAIRRGAFSSVKELIAKIERFVKAYNAKSHPFTWTATADSILEKTARLSKAISETGH